MNPISKYVALARNAYTALTEPKIVKVAKDDKKRVSQYALRRHRTYLVEVGQQNFKDSIAIAKDPDNPNWWSLQNYYEEFMADLHLQSQIRTALYKVISEPWAIVNRESREINKDLTVMMQRQWFEDTSWLALEPEFWGPGLIEFQQMVPDEKTGELVFKQVKRFPREHLCPPKGHILINPSDTDGFSYREPPVNPWLLEVGDPQELGLLQYCGRYSIYKKFAWSDMAGSGEKWADPLLAIKSGSDDDKENDKKEEFAKNFGRNGYVILDDDDEIEVLERKSSTGNAHKIWIDQIQEANSENSKGVNGQVGTADEKSFVGAAEVQERLLGDYTEARLRALFYFHLEKTFPYLMQVRGGDTAYSALQGHMWMPLRFMKELKTPDQIEQERRELEQDQPPSPQRKPGPKGSGGGPAKKYSLGFSI